MKQLVKNLLASVGDARDLSSIPKSGKSLEEEKKNSSQWVEPMKTYLLPGLLEACPHASLGVCVFRK